MKSELVVALIFAAAAATAQSVGGAREWTPPAGESQIRPASACSSLRALTGYEFTIVKATLHPAAGDVPEFCRVIGTIQPEIKFEVAMPSAWHGRLLMQGNGGYAGEDIESPQRAGARNRSLRLGFVAAQTNTGHDGVREPLGVFAASPQKLYDYAFRAIHVTAEIAKRLSSAYYGRAPERSYFDGCSTGGRQALIAAQRFPGDFDGILAGAPVLDFSGTMLKYASWLNALKDTSFSSEGVEMLARRIYDLCDAKDGLKDGLINDPRRCDFQPARELSGGTGNAEAGPFTDRQLRALEVLYGDLVVNGRRVFPGWPVGAEVKGANGRSGWDNWLVRDGGPTIGQRFAESFFQNMAFEKPLPDFRLSQLDFERDVSRLESISEILDATDPNLALFRERGGKLLMWFGWADPALNPMMGVEYYESVVARMGPSTRDFFRLYLLPGVFHCGGGVGCDTFPRLAALINWVERGQAPEALIASRSVQGKVVRTRPLCPYPQVARYLGKGSVDDAANFRCAAPE